MRNEEKGVLSVKKGDYCEAVVETIEFPNKGVLHIDGERVIVKMLCRDRRSGL